MVCSGVLNLSAATTTVAPQALTDFWRATDIFRKKTACNVCSTTWNNETCALIRYCYINRSHYIFQSCALVSIRTMLHSRVILNEVFCILYQALMA